MASEKKPKRKYGQNWAKLSNSQADISAVYQKLVGTLPNTPQSEENTEDRDLSVNDHTENDQLQIKNDQALDQIIKDSATEDNLSPGTMTIGSKLPQSQNVPSDKMSVGSNISYKSPTNFDFTKNISSKTESENQTQNSFVQQNYSKKSVVKENINTEDKLSLGSISPWLDIESNYLKLPNSIIDNLMKTLDSSEFTVYLRLYRLSHGFRQTRCIVGYTALSEACNLSSRQIRRIIPNLTARNLIRIVEVYNEAQKQGTLYEVYTPDKLSLGKENTIKQTSGQNVPSDKMSSNKRDDDPLKRQDHHQSTIANTTDHQKRVMMIYQEVTGNLWSKADHTNYEKIKHIPIEKIEVALRLANDRATNRPNSFAFFIKEILSSLSPKTQSRSNRKKAMQKIVERIRNASVGSNLAPSEFVHKVKEVCLREDVNFDNDLLDEILSKT